MITSIIMFNPIEEKRRFVQAQIQKSFDSGINVSDEIELEKAHKDGDHHPTKPWVWVSSANGGKGDWRIEGGRSHKKASASTTDATAGSKVDISKIPGVEFKRITHMLEKKNPDHRDAERYLEEEAMSDKELKNFHAVAEHFKNSSKINKLTQEYCKKWAKLAKQEMQYRKKANSVSSNTTNKGVKAPFQVLKPEVWKLAQQYNSATGSMKSKLKTMIDGMTNGDAWTHGDYTAYFYDDDIDEYVAVTREDWSNNIQPRKTGSTDEIERMTAAGVRSSILGLNNIATNVKDKGDHFKIDFDANDFNTNGKRSPQIDRIAKFLESMGASCVIGKNEIKAYKKVEASKKKYSDMDIKDAKKALMGKTIAIKDYWGDGRGGSQDAVGKITKVYLYGSQKIPVVEITYNPREKQDIRLSDIDDGKLTNSNYKVVLDYKKVEDNNTKSTSRDTRDKIAQDAGFKDYEEMKGYQDYVTQKNLLKKKSTKSGMRMLYEQEVAKYEKDHADLIKRIKDK